MIDVEHKWGPGDLVSTLRQSTDTKLYEIQSVRNGGTVDLRIPGTNCIVLSNVSIDSLYLIKARDSEVPVVENLITGTVFTFVRLPLYKDTIEGVVVGNSVMIIAEELYAPEIWTLEDVGKTLNESTTKYITYGGYQLYSDPYVADKLAKRDLEENHGI